MFKSAILQLVFTLLVISSEAQNNVALYEGCNYSGKRAYLSPGQYRLYQLQINNDQLSSMQIPYGLRVTLYEHDEFQGSSASYTGNVACLGNGWNDNASSVVVEAINNNNNNNSADFITFFSDCYSKGFSQSLNPGTYKGNQLGNLVYNISSFTINGNLRVKVYTNDNAYGYSSTFEASESCLSSNLNDKIGSIVIEYKNGWNNNNNNNNNSYGNSYATVYTDCNYRGTNMRLSPGYYTGDKLGMFRFNISSMEIPSNLRLKVFVNNESLDGYSYTLTENSNCLSNTLNNKIGSLVVEERGGRWNPNNNNNNNNNNNYNNNTERVTIYEDEDYEGLSSSLLPGTYATMSQAGIQDNSLSSLRLPAGYRVILYEFENFRGKSYTITQSKSGFLLSGWNDKTSSIKIYKD